MKRIWIALCFVVLAVSAFAVSRSAFGEENTASQPCCSSPPQQSSPQTNHAVPDHVVYGFLFGKITHLNERTRQLQSEGRIRHTDYIPEQHEANLTPEQARALSAIASACMIEVQQQDAQARVIIERFRAQFPDRRIPAGTTPPPPPPELRTMWEERNAMILRARDRLRTAFGEEAFTRFDNYAKFRYGTNAELVPPNPVGPTRNRR